LTGESLPARRDPPCRPQIDGKAERFNRTMLDEAPCNLSRPLQRGEVATLPRRIVTCVDADLRLRWAGPNLWVQTRGRGNYT
jgi:hypothetical protein